MKKRTKISKIYFWGIGIVLVICTGFGVCCILKYIQASKGILKENSYVIDKQIDTYELNNLCLKNVSGLKEILENAGWNVSNESISDYSGSITIYYDEEQVTEIWFHDYKDQDCSWTLFGLQPGMDLDYVMNYLDRDGIVLERHNMQWYATGVQLESVGIERLEWDPSEQISYLKAEIASGTLEDVNNCLFYTEDKKLDYRDEKRNVSVTIAYPVVHLEANEQTERVINRNIESVIQNIWERVEVSDLQDANFNVAYTVENAESECFSIKWEGKYTDIEGETEILEALTCNILEEGRMLGITEVGLSMEEIVSEIAWRIEVDEDDLREQLCENYHKFYITPLHLILIYKDNETQEEAVVSMWR